MHHVRFATEPSVFGQSMYGLFLLYGVTDMPPAPFIPKNTKEISRLKGYGREFGARASGAVLRYFRNDARRNEILQDVLSTVFMKLYADPNLESQLKGKSLSFAEHYVLKAVQNESIDQSRKEKIRKHDNFEDLVDQPGNWDNLGEMIPQSEQDQILNEIENSVSPLMSKDIGLYFKLILDGYSDAEITRGKMLPYMEDKTITPDKADGRLYKYKKTIKDVLENHFGL